MLSFERLARRLRRSAPFAAPEMLLARKFARRGFIATEKTTAAPAPGALERFFESRTEGPGIWKWRHYFPIYERHLAKFVGTDAVIAEVGIYSGGSLDMWRDYFGPEAHIVGIDIEEACRVYESPGTSVVIGDQGDRAFWRGFRARFPRLDVIIDDGGHQYEQQRATLEETLSHLRPGGVYICEDIHGIHNQFAAYALGLAAQLNDIRATGRTTSATSTFQRSILSMHFYPYVVVIEKSTGPIEQLTAPKQGTQWQPFL